MSIEPDYVRLMEKVSSILHMKHQSCKFTSLPSHMYIHTHTHTHTHTHQLLLVYAPLLLPWVAAVSISAPSTQHSPYRHYHLPIAITILYAHIHLEDSWLPETDWQLLVSERLWCVWVPHLLHFIALGLQWLLRLTVRGTLEAVHCIVRGRPPWRVSCALVVVAMATLFVCSSVSLLLMTVAYALNVSIRTLWTACSAHMRTCGATCGQS